MCVRACVVCTHVCSVYACVCVCVTYVGVHMWVCVCGCVAHSMYVCECVHACMCVVYQVHLFKFVVTILLHHSRSLVFPILQ